MGQVLHGSATTTEVVRRAIQNIQESIRALGERYSVNPKTISKWRRCEIVTDRKTGPKEARSTVLSPEEEAVVVAFRRYTLFPLDDCLYGPQRVPQTVIEAAVAAGATPRQRLWKVELPIAFPEILLGINQTIMMALAMVAITALIGSRDLGQEIYKALPGADTGRGLLAGLGIAFIGIIASRLIGGWAAKMKQQLGMTV